MNQDKVSIRDREESLRNFLRNKRDKDNQSVNSLAKEIGINETTIRDFIEDDSKRSLGKKNYNKIVGFFKGFPLKLTYMEFAGLCEILKGVLEKQSVRWDFQTTLEKDEMDAYSKLRDFVVKEAVIDKGSNVGSQSYSLLEMINPPSEVDRFDQYTKLANYKKDFDTEFNQIAILAATYHNFLWSGNTKEILIFLMPKANYLKAKNEWENLNPGKDFSLDISGPSLFSPYVKK